VLKFITSKPLWVNILVGCAIVLVLVFSFFGMLDWITDHGHYEKVPDVVGQNIEAAKLVLKERGFTVEVIDSIYNSSFPKLSITKQSPDGDALVKHGRTIYLTVNRATLPLVEMPNMVGFSIKSAEIYLKSLGLLMGDTTYKPDIARNAVLEQLYNGTELKPGSKIPVGSVISFVLGSGIGNGQADMPDLVGLTFSQAKTLLAKMNVSVSIPIAEGGVADTANAYVIKQKPEVYAEPVPGQKVVNKIRAGQIVDLWISETAPEKTDTLDTQPLQ